MSEACKTCGAFPHPHNKLLRKKDEEITDAARKLSAARAQIAEYRSRADAVESVHYHAKLAVDNAEFKQREAERITEELRAKLLEYQAALIESDRELHQVQQTIATIQAETINNSYLHQGNGTK